MGYDIAQFEGEVDEEFICPICSGVLEDPLHFPLCEHAFCKGCIDKWLIRQNSCPVDRRACTRSDLKAVPRLLKNLLSRLLVKCNYVSFGCDAVVKLERLEVHREVCEHDPKKLVPGTYVAKDGLVRKLEKLQCIISEIKVAISDIHEVNASMQDRIRNFNLDDPSVPANAKSSQQGASCDRGRRSTAGVQAQPEPYRSIFF